MSITVGSLFSGIGGLDLGLEQAGMKTVWQVEFDDWARGKLDENFPHTEKFKDVREVGKHNLRPVDLIAGGFPCQDLSIANLKGLGLAGERSGLWREYLRIIRELLPRYIFIENVSALLTDGLDRLLCDLAACGYDAEWQIIRATAFGLPHQRKRLFVIAYPEGDRLLQDEVFKGNRYQNHFPASVSRGQPLLHFDVIGCSYPQIPEHLRMDDGLSFELSEIEAAIKGYGNAVCPPVARWIGERIVEFDERCRQNKAIKASEETVEE
ncbi:DNA cytosine methyltransferase [Geitlerinema calcuttense]|uniref:Cytosine-specific methyltransferase n=1 Tax=Geitlerinema calcuttense NRMC-F 0142 TaxID=2922238 RepID=A0ABT7LV51_9CYAN|nr:DNA (cytosine-5-)-methyltransferase [Geitlerinema calcuttense]MDL5055928.1 DNA (cytosine-5-)-methyltransferase [Geitlerinema calcuttense NRMC-F 0142]